MTPPTLLPRLLAALLACASAAAHHIHIFDAHHAGPASHGAPLPSTVSPATARLILAARLDLGAHIAVGGGVDDAGLAAVNALGGFAASPLAGRSRPTGHGEDERRGLVVVQGVDRPEDVLPRDMQRWRSFSVSSVPHKERTEELVAELEAAMEDAAMKEFGFAPPKIDADKEPWLWHINGRGIYHKKRLGRLGQEFGPNSRKYKEEATRIRLTIEGILENFASLTVVVLPSERHCDGSATWGVTPRPRPQRERRQAAPMTSPNERVAVAPSLPSRYASLVDCQRATANCTGHGHCRVVYSETGSSDRRYDFYGCVCDIPELERSKDGSVRKTTRFGGAACQKVDVSVPFWILLSTTVFLILVVYMGVGMLFYMGNEELPSVLGAGVSGPRAK